MAERTAPLRPVVEIGTFAFGVATMKTLPRGKEIGLPVVEIRAVASGPEIRKLRGLPTEVYKKNSYYTFSNSLYDVKVTGQDYKQVATTYIQRLLEAVRKDQDIYWYAGLVIDA